MGGFEVVIHAKYGISAHVLEEEELMRTEMLVSVTIPAPTEDDASAVEASQDG